MADSWNLIGPEYRLAKLLCQALEDLGGPEVSHFGSEWNYWSSSLTNLPQFTLDLLLRKRSKVEHGSTEKVSPGPLVRENELVFQIKNPKTLEMSNPKQQQIIPLRG